MHIVLLGEISQRTKPSRGGTGLDLVRIANMLFDKVYRVSIIASSTERFKLIREKANYNINFFCIGYSNKYFQFAYLSYFILKLKPDVLIARDTRAILLATWFKKYITKKICLISSIHNENVVRKTKTKNKSSTKLKKMELLKKHSDGIICVSPGIQEALLQWINYDTQKIKIIPNPAFSQIDINNSEYISRPLSSAYHIVNIGRLTPEKGHKYLIFSLYQLVYQYKIEIALTIIGEGKLEFELKSYAEKLNLSNYIFFLGYVTNPLSYLADADLYVCSSLQEAFGYTLVEALSMGVPVVSTDCPYGPRYILDDGNYGTLVPIRDSTTLASAIYNNLNINHNKQILTERSKEFSKEIILQSYSDFINFVYSSRFNTLS